MEFHQQLANIERSISDPHKVRKSVSLDMIGQVAGITYLIHELRRISNPRVLYYRGEISKSLHISDLYVPNPDGSLTCLKLQRKEVLIDAIKENPRIIITNKSRTKVLSPEILSNMRAEPTTENISQNILMWLASEHLRLGNDAILYPLKSFAPDRFLEFLGDSESDILDEAFYSVRDFIRKFDGVVSTLAGQDDCIKLSLENGLLVVSKLGTIYQFKMYEENNRRHDEWSECWSGWNTI